MSICQDPILEKLLLEHVEPRLRELLIACGFSNEPHRRMTSFRQCYPKKTERLLYSVTVEFNPRGNSFYFDIYKDGEVYG